MRKIILITWLCLLILGGSANAAAGAIKLVTEGSGDEYPHFLHMRGDPVIEGETVMVPLQDLADELGWSVTWDASTSNIYVQGNGKQMQMKIGSQQVMVNALSMEIPLPPRMTDGNIMIPLSFVSGSLGYYVESSKFWSNSDQIYITPYKLISDEEVARSDQMNFTKSVDSYGFVTLHLKENGTTPGGIRLNSSIWDVLQVYGVPRGPCRSLNYSGDWTGKLIYWGTFIPQSGAGTFYEFTFEHGLLVNLTISC